MIPGDPSVSSPARDNGRDRHERTKLLRASGLRRQLAELVAGRAPIIVEFGCGHGHFLSTYAATHPERRCLGVDFSRDRILRASRKQHRLQLDNLFFVHAEAGEFLDALPSGTWFAEVFVLFPDPWPKRRHRKNRLVSEVFLSRLAGLMRSGGRFFFRTDRDDYFEAVARLMNGGGAWQAELDPTWGFDCPTVFQEKVEAYRSLCAIKLG